MKWSKVKAECPLCKQRFKSIIHNVRSIEDYDEYHLQTGAENPDPWNSTVNLEIVQRFRYRTTLTHNRRLERVLEHLERDLQRGVEPGDVIPPYATWHQQRRVPSFDFRVSVYRENLWVNSLPILGRPRDISPDHLRRHPEEMQRMIPWLSRELFAILRAPGISNHVLERVLDLLPNHEIHSRQFWTGVETYLRHHCDHFIHEFYNFARSPYDMIGFDENAVYSGRTNAPIHVVHEVTSDSSDSDVIILPSDDTQTPSTTRRQRPHALLPRSRSPVAGPSRAVLPVDEPSPSEGNAGSSSESTISLPSGFQDLSRGNITGADGSDSDSCVIVGSVKPLHERTPEIISLSSSDPEGDVKELSQTGTALYDISDSYLYTSSTSSVESSGSEYDPRTVHKSQRKKVNRKGKCDGTGKCKVKTSCNGGSKATVTSTKRQVNTKREYSSSDSDSSVSSCSDKRSYRRRRAQSSSSHSSASVSSSSSSSWKPTYTSRKSYSSRTGLNTRRSSCNDKGLWRIKIKVPDVKHEHDYSVVDFEARNLSDSSVRSPSRPASRPKLRSIVITKAAKGTGRHQTPVDNSHDKPQKRLTKKGQLHRQDGAVRKVKDGLIKDEFNASPSASSSSYRHKGGSQSSHSSRKYEGSRKCSSRSSNRQKHSKKDKKKMKSKRQKDSDSSTEWKSRGLKSKKPKRVLSSFSYSSDDSD